MAERRRKTDPEIVESPARTMAVVRTKDGLDELGVRLFKALDEAVHTLTSGRPALRHRHDL